MSSQVEKKHYQEDEDPLLVRSKKSGLGPLTDLSWRVCLPLGVVRLRNSLVWQETIEPVMTAYKLVTVEFRYWGLQGKVERFAQNVLFFFVNLDFVITLAL